MPDPTISSHLATAKPSGALQKISYIATRLSTLKRIIVLRLNGDDHLKETTTSAGV